MGINGLKDAVNGLELHFRGLLRELKRPNAYHIFAGSGPEAELNLGFGLGFAGDLRVMDEAVAGASVGRQLAGAGELQALDNGGFAGAVGADD